MDTTTSANLTDSPASVWQHFAALCAIPRISKNEAGAREYVLRVAAAAGAETQVDAAGNVVVRVAATDGGGDDATRLVGLQSHLDMVPAVADGMKHDFAADPILTVREGEWLTTGDRTTLGADNGIGVALMLAFLTTSGLTHGPLELLFTVEEEIGLVGARELDPALVRARRMINLDNEDPHDILIGCAGGGGAVVTFRPAVEPVGDNAVACTVQVSGLLGGHSGIEIHRHRANAIKVLGRVLADVAATEADLRIASLTGGGVGNKIPALSQATFVIASGDRAIVQQAVGAAEEAMRAEFGDDEPGLKISLTEAPRPGRVLTDADTTRLLALIADLPHGVQSMSSVYNAVETSCNLSTAIVAGAHTAIFSISCRSLVNSGTPELQSRIAAIAGTHGVTAALENGYPCWEPKADSSLLAAARQTYETVYGHPANVTVVHAGVECGTIISRAPGLDAIAVGPLIEGAHTPRERVNVPSVAEFWTYLTALVRDLQTG